MQSFAQGYLPPPQTGPQAPPPPQSAIAGNGEYVAPMQQQTQQTYVPQSVAMSGPRQINGWSEGDPIPPGYHPISRVRGGLVAGGASLFGAMYLLFGLLPATIDSDSCSGYSGSSCHNTLWPLYIPVVGPFITMGTNGSHSTTVGLLLAIDGLAQAGGMAMMIFGAIGRTVLMRNDLGMNPLEFRVGQAKKLELQPMMGMGMTQSGTGGGFKLTF